MRHEEAPSLTWISASGTIRLHGILRMSEIPDIVNVALDFLHAPHRLNCSFTSIRGPGHRGESYLVAACPLLLRNLGPNKLCNSLCTVLSCTGAGVEYTSLSLSSLHISSLYERRRVPQLFALRGAEFTASLQEDAVDLEIPAQVHTMG